jgi:hypothetical protein
MATSRQIEANRRNASKSTGPRTAVGKARSSRNALRYGPLPTLRPEDKPAIDAMARQLVEATGGNTEDAATVAEARILATRLRLEHNGLLQTILSPYGSANRAQVQRLDALYHRERRAGRRARRALRRMIEAVGR